MNYGTLIEASHLKLDNDDWAIIDTRFYLAEPDKGEAAYLAGHIPGAVYAHLDRDLSATPTGTNGRHPLPSAEHMAERFSSWGIDEDVQVVAYDDVGGQFAARLWWMLRYLGHHAVAVLNGGLPAFDGELRTGREQRTARSFTPQARESMRIDVDALVTTRHEHLLVDARAGERFRGESETLDPVAGHIPGANSLPCASNLDGDGRFIPTDELRARFTPVIGERDASEVVSYCGSGVTACHNLLAMETAGIYGARLYPGSWSEWCADESRPVETA